MADTPLITFIVPTYNVPQWMLRECIDSILAQPLSATEREIIVVDDGSDSPVQPMDGVTVIRQPNGGLSAARNAALDVASGEWVEFVDSDDYLLPAWGNVLPLLSDKSLDVVRIGVEHDSDSVHRTTASHHLTHDNLQAAACRYVMRRSLLDSTDLAVQHSHCDNSLCSTHDQLRLTHDRLRFTRGILHEDEEFTPLMLARAGEMVVLGRRCYYYRQRTGSIMHRPDAAHIARRLDDVEGVIARLHGHNTPVLRRRIAQLTMDYIYNSLRLERSLKATRRRTARLREQGLWPLPKLPATRKYHLFRLLTLLFLN